jgi:CRP/FNR family cyclic AMP-dependent transcriptional regulator
LFLMAGKENFKAGDIIFKEGSHGVGVYIIRSGMVEISKMIQDKKIVVETLGPGEILGEMSFLDPAPRSATATALEDTVLELVDKDYLDSQFNQITSDFREVICSLVKRLRKTTGILGSSIPRRTEERTSMKIRISFKRANDFFRAYIGNLGGGGLFIKTTQSLPVATLLNLEFNLPDSDHLITTKGKVVWTRSSETSDEKKPPGMGIQFIDMDSQDSERVKNYITNFKF